MDWNTVVEKMGPALFRYFAASFTLATADDLTQETLIRLVRKVEAGQYHPEQGSLLKYAYGIARFVRLEALKARPLPVEADPAAPRAHASPEAALEEKRRIGELQRGLDRLPDIQREILLLVLDEELSLVEIASLMEMPLGTVKSHIHRAKAELSRYFSKRESKDE
jgi:RNA polymerase sigma-70 factor (ECF subfamily)